MALNLMKKSLTRLRLINWHYFEDETIAFNGATLISGINASGKSTILDAVKMVLTVDTRHFNIAANENSKRDLMGYVRCKLGEDEKAYNRDGVVISHVALEFCDEDKKKNFVLGVVHTSNDEQSQILSKWYIAECNLDELTFIVGERPATPKELRSNLILLERKDARERFLSRLGRLDEKFFEMIQKAIAFKPMKNVKDFIKNFLLTESNVDFESLKETINNVRELENLYNQCVAQKKMLDEIVDCSNEYRARQDEILVDEILLDLANFDISDQKVKEVEEKIKRVGREINQKEELKSTKNTTVDELNEKLDVVKDSLRDSDIGRLIVSIDGQIKQVLDSCDKERKKIDNLNKNLDCLKKYLSLLKNSDYVFPISAQEFVDISSDVLQFDKKEIILDRLVSSDEKIKNDISENYYNLDRQRKDIDDDLVRLSQRKKSLEERKHTYPTKSAQFKALVEAELSKIGIDDSTCYLCELLEIKDDSWRNAIEGILGDYRFALVVDSKDFSVAYEILQKNHLESSMLINTEEVLNFDVNTESGSLAQQIECKNELSSKYIASILGNIICCSSHNDVLKFKKSITQDCMLYLDGTIYSLPEDRYRTPFVGMKAYELQLERVNSEIDEKKKMLSEIKPKLSFAKNLKDAREYVKYDAIRDLMDSPFQLRTMQEQIADLRNQKREAENNPDFIQLGEQKRRLDEKIKSLNTEIRELSDALIKLNATAQSSSDELKKRIEAFENNRNVCECREQDEPVAYADAVQKYNQHRKTKTPETVVDNFSRRLVALNTDADKILDTLKKMQSRYNVQFTSDIPDGMVAINQYIDVQTRLRNIVIKDRQQNLESARKQSEDIFKSDFLLKMQDMIRKAKQQFKELNDCLGKLAYGGDTYRFTITSNREKESMYKMIMDENNMGTESLWTSTFEQNYKQELDDLYGKLLSDKDSDNKLVQEYSDYRNYLDFDIKIRKPNGGEITYSRVVGEKSGAETQIPFYVAIAASFYILYQREGSIRLILFDEAFEKMDESRIGTMMQFFKSLNLQTVLVTPPEKIESIGNFVDSVLAVCREGECSYVMDYGYEKEAAE
ncbi:ATP-binding protein [uncultured Fibrobacter sp.]|uniref:ATP-binding protein n=1 Tax=uncultured Fibrobacter sp. TaxID=261512 RepID=UPI0025FB1F7D|nr:SbcC/MukB-like Walker B domain-containing protein [uncultured Fibrobacter sp.]